MKGAFMVEPLRAVQVAGRHIVRWLTMSATGVSIYTAAQELQQAGAAQITALVLHRTP
jgi:phosphoribosylpyrophosphate synthetase